MHASVDPVRFRRTDGWLRALSATMFVLALACVAMVAVIAIRYASTELVLVLIVGALLHTVYRYSGKLGYVRVGPRFSGTYFLDANDISALRLPQRVQEELVAKFSVGVFPGVGPGGILVPRLFGKHLLLVSMTLAEQTGREGMQALILHEKGHARVGDLTQSIVLEAGAEVMLYLWWLGVLIVLAHPLLLVGASGARIVDLFSIANFDTMVAYEPCHSLAQPPRDESPHGGLVRRVQYSRTVI